MSNAEIADGSESGTPAQGGDDTKSAGAGNALAPMTCSVPPRCGVADAPVRRDDRPQRVARALAALHLTAVSGFVDAVGAVHLAGLNISFMSGNTTDLAVALVSDHGARLLLIAAIVATFVFGAYLGTLIGIVVRPQLLVLTIGLCEAALLTSAIALHGRVADGLSCLPLCLAMAMQNRLREDVAGVELGATFVTGTLYKLGAQLAHLRLGGGDHFQAHLLAATWLSLLAGAGTATAALLTHGYETTLWIALGLLTMPLTLRAVLELRPARPAVSG
ncbi:YoaK family protein [Acuticoccus sediminis]|uniref:YoaK family protein n=1 Tax=Acuticoccus sediminis TaxID=2184697 RepID=UPI0013907607|nr:YoaK family protein [Acuticoccus sediminis]